MTPKNTLKNKKVLLMGLGILGGGLNMANWLIEKGAKLTITDLKSRKELKNSIKKLKNKEIKFVLGKHNEKTNRR
jgi:UDP-N-acetylmuramoylalanine--D-glutamate ligase